MIGCCRLGWADDNHRLAARWPRVAIMGGEVREAPAPDLLVQLGQLARHGCGPVAEELGHVAEACGPQPWRAS